MDEIWQIQHYRDPDGTEPVREFIKDSFLTQGELKQLEVRLKLLRASGLRLLRERADILEKIKTEDNLYELRLDNTPNNPRFFLCAFTGKILVLVHAFKKKGRKTPQCEISIAAKRRDLILIKEESNDTESTSR